MDSHVTSETIQSEGPSLKPAQKPKVLILVGAPGSGKSTFANSLCYYDKSWCRVNQDDMGDRRTCERFTYEWLTEGKNVVIDRCNFDSAQRKTWIRIAFEFDLCPEVIFFATSFQSCEVRVRNREEHPTGVHGKEGLGILRKFQQMLTKPTFQEGFYRIFITDTQKFTFSNGYYSDSDVSHIMTSLANSPINANYSYIQAEFNLETSQRSAAHTNHQYNYHNGYRQQSNSRSNYGSRDHSANHVRYTQGQTQYQPRNVGRPASNNWRHRQPNGHHNPEQSTLPPNHSNQPWSNHQGFHHSSARGNYQRQPQLDFYPPPPNEHNSPQKDI
ncbi:hypothetical protein K7432_005472 [Basidiobolus ranarum]|uniref:P-loop containing nucleoside triphosphate hydrolase protein n=1 Tax=Basidiobolus ranarum TaxID=34480 RepID=A0ABR2WWI3_9FUNG